MDLKKKAEENPALFVLAVAFAGWLAGFASYRGLLEINDRTTIGRDQKAKLESDLAAARTTLEGRLRTPAVSPEARPTRLQPSPAATPSPAPAQAGSTALTVVPTPSYLAALRSLRDEGKLLPFGSDPFGRTKEELFDQTRFRGWRERCLTILPAVDKQLGLNGPRSWSNRFREETSDPPALALSLHPGPEFRERARAGIETLSLLILKLEAGV
jgi:hypothetical protein